MSIADTHRRYAAHFTHLVENTSDWNLQSPVADWRARDVVEHLTSWLPGMMRSLGVELADVTDRNPVRAWADLTAQVQVLLDDPERAGQLVQDFSGGQSTVEDLLAKYYLPDVFMHTWDLARATGQDATLDPDTTQNLVEAMTGAADMLRASGQYGDPVVLDDSHPMQDRLIALIGRDPHWTAPVVDTPDGQMPAGAIDETTEEVVLPVDELMSDPQDPDARRSGGRA
ncbi:hypothetical protein [Aestuariimicrobium kwangyangense]|uniref:hypothetical protein n=1 Tax=Aestuariimicrobium kwangyangense TaxID=396389 RepID=UPI0003B4D7D6|nr:hypothetical protein [Aestuariimicrobium kwangyangense]